MDALCCPRCGAGMGRVKIVTEIGESCISWGCYKCGECIDEEILKNRDAVIRKEEPGPTRDPGSSRTIIWGRKE